MNRSTKKSKNKSEITWKQMNMKTQWSKILRYSKSGSKRKVYSNTGLPQEARKIKNKPTNLTYKKTRKSKTNISPKQQKEVNNKD